MAAVAGRVLDAVGAENKTKEALTEMRRPCWPVAAAALGVVVVPLVLWVLVPGLPARLESVEGFHWVGEEAGTGRALLVSEQFDGRRVLAGSDRFAIPKDEPLRCHDGSVEPLRETAKARGRIEDLALSIGFFRRLTVTFDDLGGPQMTYLYRCSSKGPQPLLSWGIVPGFGVWAFAVGWVMWMAGWRIASNVVRWFRRFSSRA